MNNFYITQQSSFCHWFYFMRLNLKGVDSEIQITDDFGNLVKVDHIVSRVLAA